jgi:hypothetical protein
MWKEEKGREIESRGVSEAGKGIGRAQRMAKGVKGEILQRDSRIEKNKRNQN